MATLYPVAGSKLYIGDQVNGKGTVTAADFAGVTWTEIGGWANAGTIGDTQEIGAQSLINEGGRVRKFKTTKDGGTMENSFVPMSSDPGQIKFKEAIESCKPYAFKIEWSSDCMPESTVTISVAAPAVVTWNAHGLTAGQPVMFSSTGELPTGLQAGVIYYVSATGLTTNEFSVSATQGGAAIDTTAAGSGTHTASAPPVGMTDLFYGLALPGARSGGDATAANLRTWSIAVDSNIVEI